MITIRSIYEAQKRISPYIYQTPLLRLHNLDRYLGCQVYAKMESMQKTNSFKVRGALNALLTLPQDALARGIIAASSGNHGSDRLRGSTSRCQGAWSFPTTHQSQGPGIQSYGAEIIYSVPSERFDLAKQLSEEHSWSFVFTLRRCCHHGRPGTAALEILEQLPDELPYCSYRRRRAN